MKTQLIALAICALTIARSGYAQATDKTILAEQLLVAMEMEQTNEQTFEVMKQSMPAMMKSMGAESSSADSQEMVDKVMTFVSEEMSWDNVKDAYIAMYAETFTEEELQGLTEFYKSPIGKKFIIKQPELLQRSMEMSQQIMMSAMPRMQALLKQAE